MSPPFTRALPKKIVLPVLEEHSGLKFNKDFYVGYSPERINPGDKEHTIVYDIKGALPKDKVDARL